MALEVLSETPKLVFHSKIIIVNARDSAYCAECSRILDCDLFLRLPRINNS